TIHIVEIPEDAGAIRGSPKLKTVDNPGVEGLSSLFVGFSVCGSKSFEERLLSRGIELEGIERLLLTNAKKFRIAAGASVGHPTGLGCYCCRTLHQECG